MKKIIFHEGETCFGGLVGSGQVSNKFLFGNIILLIGVRGGSVEREG